ncbi:AAA family ATPase [Sphaerotilus sp.]|uniref:AAA family ATPase n=1 Tax=Sphaerotilus sp. TaxID=2093942 RepID=UPI0025F7B55D|nr:AAA family ATPase [Sphaerotilus sp.]
MKTAAQESTMFLRSAHIRHYKSLDDVRVEFTRPITVIVGPNAVGKSNFVDALRFASETAVQSPMAVAVIQRGGIQRIRQHGTTASDPVRIRLGLSEFPRAAENAHVEYTLETTEDGRYSIGNRHSGMDVHNLYGDSERLRNWCFSSIFPNTLRQPGFTDQPDRLREDGSNWASVTKALRKTNGGKAALQRIGDSMRCAIPGFRDIRVRAVGNYLVPHFVFDDANKSVEFDPLQLSDGTLRIFGLLLAIYQLPAPTLLVIEEPEHTVYPGALGVLVDAMREASEQTQIILTTHSPDLVHYFKPDEIRVATIENGHTRIAPICAPQRAAIDEHLMTAEEFMRAEGLQPEPVQTPTT